MSSCIVNPLNLSDSITQLLPPESPLLVLLFFIFLLSTASIIIVIYQFILFSFKWAYYHHLLCIFLYSIFSLCYFFSLFVCVLSICVDGIGLGSSPTSSQNEALPPSSDWPVSAYTSSFNLSSPETDDAGTWFIHNVLSPLCSSWITANQHYPLPPVTVTNRAPTTHWRATSPVHPFICNQEHWRSWLHVTLVWALSLSTLSLMQCIFPLWC